MGTIISFFDYSNQETNSNIENNTIDDDYNIIHSQNIEDHVVAKHFVDNVLKEVVDDFIMNQVDKVKEIEDEVKEEDVVVIKEHEVKEIEDDVVVNKEHEVVDIEDVVVIKDKFDVLDINECKKKKKKKKKKMII